MRVLEIANKGIVVQMDRDEFDNCLNNALDDQYRIGYETGYRDYERLNEKEEKIWGQTWSDDHADMDDDDPEKE